MANNSIDLSTLDFATIKQNLKNHLKGQDIFKDYDFDGSNMSVLLDVLAYNTSLQSYYMNMLMSESFLDSAQMRSSVLSHAKELNYLPKSYKSARATIRIRVEQNNSDSLIIPKGTSFTSTYNSQNYSFTTDQVKSYFTTLNTDTNTYIFTSEDIEIYEGMYVTESFVMDYNDSGQRFILTNPSIDTDSIIVNSIEDNGSTIVNYSYSETLLGLTNQSRKFFLQATEDGNYEIVFGDDIIGRKPADSASIVVQYRVASGADPNGCSSFVPDVDLTSDSSGRVSVITVSRADGGVEAESLSSIKYNAPRHFQTQQRAVTTNDYEILLKSQFPEIRAISVYGGENLDPPQYGKVFISTSLSDSDILPESKKDEYSSFIKPKMSMPLVPVFINPTYVYAKLISNIKYNLNVTTLKPDEIRLLVADKIAIYAEANLNDFNSTIHYSKLIKEIDDAHSSIISNDTDITIYKKITPVVNAIQNININYGMPLRSDVPHIHDSHGINELRVVYSSSFIYNNELCILEDNGEGSIRIMKTSSQGVTLVKEVGSVDYESGRVQINGFTCSSFNGESLRLYAMPGSKDVTSSQSDVLKIENNEISITVEAVRE